MIDGNGYGSESPFVAQQKQGSWGGEMSYLPSFAAPGGVKMSPVLAEFVAAFDNRWEDEEAIDVADGEACYLECRAPARDRRQDLIDNLMDRTCAGKAHRGTTRVRRLPVGSSRGSWPISTSIVGRSWTSP